LSQYYIFYVGKNHNRSVTYLTIPIVQIVSYFCIIVVIVGAELIIELPIKKKNNKRSDDDHQLGTVQYKCSTNFTKSLHDN
jgi:uncharacterized BrkB/YihY/UPF0761 family membrane protein